MLFSAGDSPDVFGMILGRLALCNGILDCEDETGSDSMEGSSTVGSRRGVVASWVGADVWAGDSTADAASANAASTSPGDGIGGIGVDGTSGMVNTRSFAGV